MKQLFRHALVSLAVISSLSGVLAVAYPAQVSADCNRFLTFPYWYKSLVANKNTCELKEISNEVNGNKSKRVDLQTFILIVLLNITEMILQLVAYMAVAFLIVGGFKYITSTGDANGMANAKKTVLNAIIGLIIALLSVGIVNVAAGAF